MHVVASTFYTHTCCLLILNPWPVGLGSGALVAVHTITVYARVDLQKVGHACPGGGQQQLVYSCEINSRQPVPQSRPTAEAVCVVREVRGSRGSAMRLRHTRVIMMLR